MNWLLPESVSTFGADIDRIYYLILWITGIVFVGTEALLLYFVVRYRHRDGRKAEYLHGSTRAEVVWTITPFLIVLAIAFMSRGVWLDVRDPDRIPDGAMPLLVSAKQFEWNVTYPGPDGRIGTDDDLTTRNELHVPVDRPVRATLTSEDVIHSFFIPQFRVKQDVVPGMETTIWFEATEPGEYDLACAELCGLGHYRMGAAVTVHTAAGYDEWMNAELAAADQEEQ